MNRNIPYALAFLLMLFLTGIALASCERVTELNYNPEDAGSKDAAF